MNAPVDVTTPTSVVIATRGAGALIEGEPRSLVVEAVRSFTTTSRHDELELVIVHHETTPDATLAALTEIPGIDLVLVPFAGPYAPAALLNVGALHASGDVLVFLDESAHARSDEAVGRLIAPLARAGVGATGPKLLTPDGTIHTAGIRLGDAAAEHPWRGEPDAPDTSAELFVDRTVDAVDGSCVAITADLFHALGGWSEEVPDRFRDVDLALKVRRAGLTVDWVATAVLCHFRPQDRSSNPRRWEVDFVTRRWGRDLTPAVGDAT